MNRHLCFFRAAAVCKRAAGCPAGFSLIELMIALVVSTLLVGAVLNFFDSQRNTYLEEELRLERDQNLRFAMDVLTRELRLAGGGIAGEGILRSLESWVPEAFIPSYPMAVALDANPKITQGKEGASDMVTFLCVLPTATNPTWLKADSDGTFLAPALSKSALAGQFRIGDLVSAGYLPVTARVVGVRSDRLLVDADPMLPGVQAFPDALHAHLPVGEVSVVSYAVFDDVNDSDCLRHEQGRPQLKRKVNAGGFQPVAYISRMKLAAMPAGGVRIDLAAQRHDTGVGAKDAGLRHLSAEVFLRNAPGAGEGTTCVKPGAVEDVTVAGGLDAGRPCAVLLSWTAVRENQAGERLDVRRCPVTGYRIYYDEVPGANGYYLDVPPEDAAGCLVDVGHLKSGEVYVAVAAKNSGGVGALSAEHRLVDQTAPDPPVGVSAAIDHGGALLISWHAPEVCDLAGFAVYRKPGVAGFGLAASVFDTGPQVTYTDRGLPGGVQYTYRVASVDHGLNQSAFSAEVTVSLP